MQQRVFRGQHTQRFVITPRDRNNAGIHSQLTVQETIQKVINERILLTVRLCESENGANYRLDGPFPRANYISVM